MPSYTTGRLLLRPFTPEDFDALFRIYSRADVARFLYQGARSEAEVRELLGRRVANHAIDRRGATLSLAILLPEGRELIGDCFVQWTDNEHHQGEIGYVLHPDHHGRGYATEAARTLLRIAFEEAELHRVVGRLEARNAASARVLEKLGMRREAHFVENEFVRGEWQSELVFAILRTEWQAAVGRPESTQS
jgi:RimJ/RimL family protein N-acetyltransferase